MLQIKQSIPNESQAMNRISNFAYTVAPVLLFSATSVFAQGIEATSTPQTRADDWVLISFLGSCISFAAAFVLMWLAHRNGAIGFLKGKAARLLSAISYVLPVGVGAIFYILGALSANETTAVSTDKLIWTMTWPVVFIVVFWLGFVQIKKWDATRPEKPIPDANPLIPQAGLIPKPDAPLVIYIGGTGVDVALMHLRLRAVVGGDLSKIVILDYDTNSDSQSGVVSAPRIATLQKLSQFLRGSPQAISVIPISQPGGGKTTLPEMFDLPAASKALRWLVPASWDGLRATEGAFRRPAFGATVLTCSLSQANSLEGVLELSAAAFKAGKSVTIVAGISGGTGPSAAPSIAQRLIPQIGTQGGKLHVVAVPSWFAVSGQHEINNELKANRNATLHYLANESVFKDANVKLHVLQWPHVVERPFAGDKQQPEDPHYVSAIVASVVMDIERGFSEFAHNSAGHALTLRAPIENNSKQLKLKTKSPVLAIPASGEKNSYLTLNQVLEMAAVQEASLRALALLLSESGDSWSSGPSSLFALETPKAVMSWLKSFEIEKRSEDKGKLRKDLCDLMSNAATDFNALIAHPLRTSVRALSKTIPLEDVGGLILEPLNPAESINKDAGMAIYSYSLQGNSLRWLVHRTASGWSEDMLVNCTSNYSVNPSNKVAGDYCRTLAGELLHSISKMFKSNPITADAADHDYGWFIPLAPNTKNVLGSSARHGFFDLTEMLRDGGQRFDGRASKPSDGDEFELYTTPNPDSHPAPFPERKMISLGLAAKAESLQYTYAKNRLIGMYFSIANGSVLQTTISQNEVGIKLWAAMMNAIKADSPSMTIPMQLETYTLNDGTPFALRLPNDTDAWVLASNKESVEHVNSWFSAYQITTQAARLGNTIAKKVLGSFESFIKNEGNKVPVRQQELLTGISDAIDHGWANPSGYLLDEHWVTYPSNKNSIAVAGDENDELLSKGLRSLAPVSSTALNEYVGVHYGGVFAKDTLDNRHYFFVEFNEVAAFVFSIPKTLADGNIKNPVFSVYAYPSLISAKSVRLGMLNLNKGLWLKGINQELKHRGRSNYSSTVFDCTQNALSLRGANGEQLGLVNMPADVGCIADVADQLAVVLDFGTSNSSVLAAAYSNADPSKLKLLQLPLKAVADTQVVCLVDSQLGFKNASNDYAGFSPWVSLSARPDYSYSGFGTEAATQAALHTLAPDFPNVSPGTNVDEVWYAAKTLDIVPFPISLPKSDGMTAVDFSHARSVPKFTPDQGDSPFENQLRQGRSAYILQMLWPTFVYLRTQGYRHIAKLVVTRPGAMSDKFANRFVEDVSAIAMRLGEHIGISIPSIAEPCLEGVAAAQMLEFAGTLEKTDLNLVIDVGGGTTDYQLTHERTHVSNGHEPEDVSFSWSMRWAGKMVEEALANCQTVRSVINPAQNGLDIDVARARLIMPYALKDETVRGKIKDILDQSEPELRVKVVFFFNVILDVAVRALAVGINAQPTHLQPRVNLALVGGAWQLYSLIATPNAGGRTLEEFIVDQLGARYGFTKVNIKNYSAGIDEIGLGGKSVIGYGALKSVLSNPQQPMHTNFNDRGCSGINLNATSSPTNQANEFCLAPFSSDKITSELSSLKSLKTLLDLPLPLSQTQPASKGTCFLDSGCKVPYSGELTDTQVIGRLIKAASSRTVNTWPILIFVEDVLKPFFEQS